MNKESLIDERKFCLWVGEHFPVHLSFFYRGLKRVAKPIRSLTGKRGQNLLYIIHLEMYDLYDLRLPKKNSANGQKCFSFRGAELWNSLPA